jgi:hypothetical protein
LWGFGARTARSWDGIFYGAARQEATNVVGKKVSIVGGGNSAGQAALFLSSYAAEVKVLVRSEGLKLSMSQYLIDQIASKANIKVLPHTQVVSVEGENHLERIEVCVDARIEMENIRFYEADALFVMIGADASTSWLPDDLERDPRGYICTGRDPPPGNSIAIHFPWRPACRACSRLVTCATTPSNEYRVAWARAAWPSLLFINTWLYSRLERTIMLGEQIPLQQWSSFF